MRLNEQVTSPSEASFGRQFDNFPHSRSSSRFIMKVLHSCMLLSSYLFIVYLGKKSLTVATHTHIAARLMRHVLKNLRNKFLEK